MRVSIQRRTIVLCPASGLDRVWVARQLDAPHIQAMFGNGAHAGVGFLLASRWSPVIVGIIHRLDGRRIGFALVIPPGEEVPTWEFAYAIPREQDRDAFSAIHTVDAMSHYLMDHMGLECFIGRTRTDNAAAQAILRRLGYRAIAQEETGGHTFSVLRLDQPGWVKRRALLERGEREHPSGQGAAFVVKLNAPAAQPWLTVNHHAALSTHQPQAPHTPLVFACPGNCGAAAVANHVAVALDDAGLAQRETVALLEARMPRTMELLHGDRPIIAVDGCSVGCVQASLAQCGVTPRRHYVLSTLGVTQQPDGAFSQLQAHQVTAVIKHDLAA